MPDPAIMQFFNLVREFEMSSGEKKRSIRIEAKKDGLFIIKGLSKLLNSSGKEVALEKPVIALYRGGA